MGSSSRVHALLALAILWAGTASAHAGTPPHQHQVLVLSEFEPGLNAGIAFTLGLREGLSLEGGDVVTTEYLDRFRFPTPLPRPEIRDWLRARYASNPPDLIVAVGGEAYQLLTNPESTPWPGKPVVFSLIDTRTVQGRALPPNVTGVTMRLAVPETLQLAEQLFPSRRQVYLVGGASESDAVFMDLVRADARRVAGEAQTVDLSGLPTAQLEERLRALPDDAVVLAAIYFRDGAGKIWPGQMIVPRLTAASRAPIFTLHATVLGFGVVGGVLIDYQALGKEVAGVTRRILAGESPAAIPVREGGQLRPLLDARQLTRWSVPMEQVPEQAVLMYREPSTWARYRWVILGALTAFLLQSALITVLLLERRRRRWAEGRFRENLAVVAHLERVGAIGEMAGAFAHELNSPLGAVVNNAQAARRFLELRQTGELEGCLVDIIADAQRAGEVIRRLRIHLRREDVQPVDVEVAAVLRDTIHLVSMNAQDRGVTLEVEVPPGLPTLRGDDVQLVQVVLNLVANAIDAVKDEPADRRRVRVTAAPQAGGVEIRVADTGHGIPAAQRAHLFEPFFTTKQVGLGMGLAISRSIVEAHGGSIRAEHPVEGGAVFVVRLPRAAPSVAASPHPAAAV